MAIEVGQLRQWKNGVLFVVLDVKPSVLGILGKDQAVDTLRLGNPSKDAFPAEVRYATWSEPTVLKESAEVADAHSAR